MRALDRAGHEAVAARNFTVDRTLPVVNSPTARVLDDARVLFTVTGSDNRCLKSALIKRCYVFFAVNSYDLIT